MTSIEMLREFKLGFDKIDSESYPEIYDGQIFMFINKSIDVIVNEGRRVFEQTTQITDNLKSLIPKKPVKILPTENTDTEYLFDLANQDYLFYIRGSFETQVNENKGKAQVVVRQQDDIEGILNDPFNKPKPYKVPITFSRNTITGYATKDFVINALYLTFVKKPGIVSISKPCDLDSQLHYSIVDNAIKLAALSLGMIKQQQQ